MKKCPQCEHMLPDEAQHCSYCGAQLSTYGHQASKTPSNNVLYAIIGALSALLIGGAILWYLTKDKPSPSTEPAVEQVTQAPEAETNTAVQAAPVQQDAGQKEELINDEGPVADDCDRLRREAADIARNQQQEHLERQKRQEPAPEKRPDSGMHRR